MNENIQYENRLIAFVDLLGFKNAVENSIKSDEIRKYIIYAIKQNERLKKDNYDDSFMNESARGVEVTFFSDSVVISYPETYDGALFFYIIRVSMAVI